MEEEVDKILGLGDKGRVLMLFSRNIDDVDLPLAFIKPEVTLYNGSSDPRVFAMFNRKYTHIHM